MHSQRPPRPLARTCCACALAALLSAGLGGCYLNSSYSGDGRISGGPTFFGPTYTIDLGVIDLAHPDERTFRISGAPEVAFCLQVHIDRDHLDRVLGSGLSIRATITDAEASVVASADGQIDGPYPTSWIVSGQELWHPALRAFTPERRGIYLLTIDATPRELDAPAPARLLLSKSAGPFP